MLFTSFLYLLFYVIYSLSMVTAKNRFGSNNSYNTTKKAKVKKKNFFLND